MRHGDSDYRHFGGDLQWDADGHADACWQRRVGFRELDGEPDASGTGAERLQQHDADDDANSGDDDLHAE